MECYRQINLIPLFQTSKRIQILKASLRCCCWVSMVNWMFYRRNFFELDLDSSFADAQCLRSIWVCVCVCLCLSVCLVWNFEAVDMGTPFLIWWYILTLSQFRMLRSQDLGKDNTVEMLICLIGHQLTCLRSRSSHGQGHSKVNL